MPYDLARSEAAQGAIRGGGGALTDQAALEAEPLPEAPAGAGDLEGALAGVEAAITELSPETQEEIRKNIEAIRDLASKDEGAAPLAAPTEGALPPGGVGLPGEPGVRA